MTCWNKFVSIFAAIVLSCTSNDATPLLRSGPSAAGDDVGDSSTSSLHQARGLEGNERPVMHTFYNRIDPTKFHKYTGMTDESDAQLLLTWKRAWRLAGWEPKIISLDDAQAHPAYAEFDKLLDLEKVPFGYYDKLCFMRWLAMASVGGGWMSDYDTFPLRGLTDASLPNGGKLTLYDTVAAGAVPSVVSGTKEEYDRIARALLENTLERGIKEEFWSDMLSLMDLHQMDHNIFEVKDQVLKGERALSGKGSFNSFRDCNVMVGGNWAVHFSHRSITQGVYLGYLPRGDSASDRPQVAHDWLMEWDEACEEIQRRGFNPDS